MTRYLLFPIFLLSLVPAHAQSTGAITGSVTDPSGAVVSAVEVICTNVATHLELRTLTNTSGLFRLADVPVGMYQVAVSHPGFSRLVRNGIELLTEHTVALDLVLQLGETSQAIVVDAPAPLVQTSTSDVQSTVDSRQMRDLPLNGRNAFQLAELTPGAVSTDATSSPGDQDNVALSVNGLRPPDNNWQLDGGSYTNKNYGSAPTLPNPDTLQEFTALTSNFSAEHRGAGAVIRLTTRSGSNDFHGSLFEFLRNNAMDTRNFFSVDTEAYKQNQYGGTMGGPIRKNRLFFFSSFQGTNKRGNPSPSLVTVPSALQHEGDFTKTGRVIADPKTGLAFPGNVIPKSRFDTVGAKVLSTIPLPNVGTNSLSAPFSANKDDYQVMAKVDYILSPKHRLSGRYFWDQNEYQSVPANNSLTGYFGANRYRNQTTLVSATHNLSPNWVMEHSFNYLRTFRTRLAFAPVYTTDLGINVPVAQEGVAPQIFFTFNGYVQLASNSFIIMNPETREYQNSVSHTQGSHFLRFGGSLRHNQQDSVNMANDAYGRWNFTTARTNIAGNNASGDAIAGLLLSVPQTFTQSAVSRQLFLSTPFDFWFQDDWKVSRRLTFNMGIRYDPFLPARDGNGVLPGFLPGAHSTVVPLAPAGLVFSGDPGIPDAIMRAHWKEFGPRVGFAWDVGGNGKTVVRAGYGIYQIGAEAFNLARNRANAAPTRALAISITAPPSTQDPYAGFPGGVPFPFVPPPVSQLATYKFPANLAVQTLDPSYNPGYTQSWNFTIERQVTRDAAISVAYVGNHFLGALSGLNLNAAVFGPGATLANEQARKPYPAFGDIAQAAGYNHGQYHGLQTTFTKRPARGLTVQASYAFAKELDLNSSGQNGGTAGELPRNVYNVNLDKGPADFDVHHSLKGSLLYEPPKLVAGGRVLRALANGWQMNTIFTARTGFPFTCRSGGDNSLSGTGHDTCDQVLADTSRPSGADPVAKWFNTAAFKQNAVGTFGQTGRGILRRPGFNNVDLSLFRRIPIRERLQAEFRIESFNVLNHANLDLFYMSAGLSQTVTSATFGQITHASDPRLVQLAMKLRF